MKHVFSTCAATDASASLRPGNFIHRCLRTFHVPALLALALLGAAPVQAIGPIAPVDFLDVYLARGYLLLVIEPEQIADLQVMRVVHQDGEPQVRAEVEWKQLRMFDYTAPLAGPDDFQYRDPREPRKPVRGRRDDATRALPSLESAQPRPTLQLGRADVPAKVSDAPPRRVGVLVPLESEAMAKLKDGVYAEKFTARARLAGASASGKPLTMQYWAHFVMRGGKPAYISQAEYSRMVDPPSDALDGAGGKIQVNLGRDIKADVPVERTKKNPAIALGRLGGVVPERDDSRKDRTQDEGARDETRER